MVYFISDVHLGFFDRETEKNREEILINFFRNIIKDADKIYLVGDIFDFWFDYKRVIPADFFRIVSKLYEMGKMGIEIEYIMGNHDFGHYNFFENELGITVHKGDIERVHNGKKFYISHGDGKNPNDKGYIILKKILRNKLSLKLYLMLHPDFGIRLASGSSQKSRVYTDARENTDSEPMREFAFSKIDNGFDYVVMGHRHKLELTQYKNGFYVNLGEWFKNPHCGIFDGNDFKLISINEFLND